MDFSKECIAEFKAEGKRYITWRKNVKPHIIRKLFYNSINGYETVEEWPIKKTFEYCSAKLLIGTGTYRQGMRYTVGDQKFYLFWSADSYWTLPRDIFVGKTVDDNLYLIGEVFGRNSGSIIKFARIPKGYVEDIPIRGKAYEHTIAAYAESFSEKDIFDEDVQCLKAAYEGVRAFSKLISMILAEH